MADFDPPFASVGGVNRSPSTDEQSDGFQCGAADLELFNRLFGRIEAELHAIQVAGGISGTEGDDTSVLQAILALIAAATGGGATSDYVLFTQAQTRLLVYPEVQTADGRVGITSPGTGQVRIPAGVTILHRGIRPYVTALADLATAASKTYHLRWQVAAGVGTFVLKDLADAGYNPTVANEANAAFDSTYDDMLVARIVTNSSNVATVTDLVNKDRIRLSGETVLVASDYTWEGSAPPSALTQTQAIPINWARTPQASLSGYTEGRFGSATQEHSIGIRATSRYRLDAFYQREDGITDALRMAYVAQA